ncbi:PepSY-like domain-containing protein [Adhaeribacter radiodurans]|uniref:PepSY-like domain-containing protein n=1 Tax=Adhaeribacter radiodurans TaxID=2745197 RepID=A0A7L7L9M6_9BACT|nr:PepSY-like domain-containing protein [Adhaeribacter radiodurans]QMU29089.1 PepSY-like domain-containing protein [Adhaeribacter radiodurans]
MKRSAFFMVAIFFSLFLFSCEKEENITAAELPQPAKDFISTHFTTATITSIQKEKEISGTSYDVFLNNGTTLDFNADGECTDIDGKTNKLPDSVLPAQVLTYVQTNHATEFIVGWEKDGNNQEVELNNGLELKFDQNYNFISLDQ